MEENIQPDEQPKRKRWSRRKKAIVFISGVALIAALYFLLPILFVVFIAQPIKVEGAAMSPTLNSGDKIFIRKRIGNLERGDIVVFYYPKDTTKSFIERIVGLPGEKIDIDANGNITVNGQALQESYLHSESNRFAVARWNAVRPEWKQLNENSYFMMGDNRDFSNDSRSYGPVSKELVYGKYLMRYWAASQ